MRAAGPQPPGHLGPEGAALGPQAPHPGRGRRRRRRRPWRGCRRPGGRPAGRDQPGIPHDGRITVIGEHTDGTCCELKAIPAGQLYPLDESLSFEEGAAFPLVFETAYRMLVTKASVREGEWALVWGIGGGVALAAFEICRALGVRTIVTSSSAEKLERARELGADVAVNHADDDVVAAVREATGGRGADVVVETVGRRPGSVRWRPPRPRASRRMRGHVRPQSPGSAVPALVEAAHRLRLDDGYAVRLRGGVRARPHPACTGARRQRGPLSEAAKAHERLESGGQFGKVVLAIPG